MLLLLFSTAGRPRRARIQGICIPPSRSSGAQGTGLVLTILLLLPKSSLQGDPLLGSRSIP